MSEGKRFRDAVYGFNKEDVNLYIEKMLKDFDERLKEKDEEISFMKNQNRELRSRLDEMMAKSDEIEALKDKITGVLVKAQEKAELMISEARVQALEEKKKIDDLTEQEKERLVDLRTELKALKTAVAITLRRHEGQLGEILQDDAG